MVQTKMLAFGSCNRQNKPQHHWDVIGGLNPTHFAWIGDAVYSKSVGIPKLQEAYHNLTTNPHYSKFTDHVIVDGVWDDHDYGINDAGRHASHQSERKAEFMKFLSHGSRNTDLRIDHDGLYHIMQVDLNGNMIKLIFLDTRTFRDDHWIRSLGEMSFKGSAIIAASLRAAYSTLGFARQYDGEMLGEPQWKWLEQTLQESKEEGVASNIVVSSVQVLTTNPLFESWGHFPTEKRRLFDLMQKTDPAGLMFLSGDVHLSEISVAKFTRADGNIGEWPEVTSSGLTHTCADGLLGFVCPIVMSLCSHHRRAGKSLYLGKNFGTLETVGDGEGWALRATIRSLPDNQPVVSHTIPLHTQQQHHQHYEHSQHSQSAIVNVDYPDYSQIPVHVTFGAIAVIISLVCCIFFGRKQKITSFTKSEEKKTT